MGIAQALLGDPMLLIVDEPTVGLDPEERVRFRTLLARLATTDERIVLLSTHIVEDIATTCDDLVVMAEGQIRFRGTPAALIDAAEGQTWELTLPSTGVPSPEWRVASTMRDGAGLRLRVVGPRPTADATPVAPTLEEAYLALMRDGASMPEIGDVTRAF